MHRKVFSSIAAVALSAAAAALGIAAAFPALAASAPASPLVGRMGATELRVDQVSELIGAQTPEVRKALAGQPDAVIPQHAEGRSSVT